MTVDRLVTAHGELILPAFLPDATRAVVRGVGSRDLESCGVPALMLNVFHLSVNPGVRLIQSLGGHHAFMDWHRPIATDSGGFQVFSLIRQNPKFGTITKDGAIFRLSKKDKRRRLTPEKAIQQQLQLGSDIVMCLDDCTDAAAPHAELEISVTRTITWAGRCKAEFERLIAERGLSPRPLLFAIIQGGDDRVLRKRCADALLELGFDGYGLGGWPLDPDGRLLTDTIAYTAELSPDDLPRFALGVGKPENVVACARFGYHLFDCTIPTRDARHRRLYAFQTDRLDRVDLSREDFYTTLYIQDEKHVRDRRPVSEVCDCLCCTNYSRAYLHHLYAIRDTLAIRLGTIHNLRFYMQLMAVIRAEHDKRP